MAVGPWGPLFTFVSGPTGWDRTGMMKRDGWSAYGFDGDRWCKRNGKGWLQVEKGRGVIEWRVTKGRVADGVSVIERDGVVSRRRPFAVCQAMIHAERAAGVPATNEGGD